MNRHALIISTATCLLWAGLAGCASSEHQRVVASSYRTATPTPIKDLEKAIKSNLEGITHLEKKQLDQAERLFKASLTFDVTYGPAHNNLGKVYYLQQKYYQAAWEFQYAANLMPNHPEPKNNLGLVLEAVGKLSEAIDAYAQAVRLEQDNPELIGNLARAHIKRGDRDAQTRGLLEELLLKDTRQDWRLWAQEYMVLLGNHAIERSSPTTTEPPAAN